MHRHPLYIVLSLMIVLIGVGDILFPYGPHPLPLPPNGRSVHFEATVCSAPSMLKEVWTADVRLPDGGRKLRLVAPEKFTFPQVGDAISVEAKMEATESRLFTPPADVSARYSRQLRRQGIVAIAYARCVVNHGKSPVMTLPERMLRKRNEWTKAYRNDFDEELCGVLAAMTLGDRTMLTPGKRELYSLTGTSHILALSGLHLSVVLVFLHLLLKPLRIWRWGHAVSIFITLCCCWGFVLLAGMPLSLVRAAAMFTVCSVVMVARRNMATSDYIPMAIILVLVFSPGSLFDVGFQLSVISVCAIVRCGSAIRVLFCSIPQSFSFGFMYYRVAYFLSYVYRRHGVLRFLSTCLRPVAKYVVTLLLVSASAVAATLPLVLHTFGMATAIGIPASLVAVPSALLLVCSGLLYMIVPAVRGLLEPFISTVYNIHSSTLEAFAQYPWASLHLRITVVGMVAAYAAMLWLVQTSWWRHWQGRFCAVALLTLVWIAELVGRALSHCLQIAL